MTDTTLERIKSLNVDEIVKDILLGWMSIRKTYGGEIKRFQFKEQSKGELRAIAKEFHRKHADTQTSRQTDVRWDEGIFEQFFSVLVYGNETYPLLAYPYDPLRAEAVDSEILKEILEKLPACFTDINVFAKIFWQEKRKSRLNLSEVDIKFLWAFFNHVKPKSSIDFPNTREVWYPDIGFSESTARNIYRRFLHLEVLVRRTLINYAKLGLVPLIKMYNNGKEVSKPETIFTTWEGDINPRTSIRLLFVPQRSSFWYEHSAKEEFILQFRCGGINIQDLSIGGWTAKKVSQLLKLLPNNTDLPSAQWKMNFETTKFPFRISDLRILNELLLIPERQIKYLGLRVNLKQGYIPSRLQQLRDAEVFQTYFRLNNTGINESAYILALGEEKDLLQIYRLASCLPRYYIMKGENCILSLVWVTPKIKTLFLDTCNHLKENLALKKIYYGKVNQKTTSPLNLSALCKLDEDGKKIWYSEPEW